MTHLIVIILFSALVAVVFGILGKETRGAQMRYGANVFLKFVGIAMVLGWFLYFIPW